MKKRMYEIDFLRSICILWIVGIWHLNGCFPPEFRFSGFMYEVGGSITEITLATFAFVSGFCLRKYQFSNRSDVLFFYKKRFTRFYLLFFLACLLMFFLLHKDNIIEGIKSEWLQFFTAITGTALLYEKPISTLWYLSMLFAFYIITPLISSNCIKGKPVINGVVLYIIMLFMVISRKTDIRLIMYFPFYCLGLWISDSVFDKVKDPKIMVASLVVSLLFIWCYVYWGIGLVKVFYLIFGVLTALGFSFICYHTSFRMIVDFMSYSSLSVYLFHRMIIPITLLIFGVEFGGERIIPIYYIPLSILLFFIIGFLIQRAYDFSIKRLTNR